MSQTNKHPEAFCIMHFKCQKCGKIELIWNSRDGVAPFVIPSGCCGEPMHHILQSLDNQKTNVNEVVSIGIKRALISPTIEQFREHVEELVEVNWNVFLRDFDSVEAAVAFFELEFEEGQPLVVGIEKLEGVDLETFKKMKELKIVLPSPNDFVLTPQKPETFSTRQPLSKRAQRRKKS